MTRHLATLRAFCTPPFRVGVDYILSRHGSVQNAFTTLAHHRLVVELHPYTGASPAEDAYTLGLGCGLPIVASGALLLYPRSLPRPQTPFGACLVAPALGCSRNLMMLQRLRETPEPPLATPFTLLDPLEFISVPAAVGPPEPAHDFQDIRAI